jgi:hypothetical protein
MQKIMMAVLQALQHEQEKAAEKAPSRADRPHDRCLRSTGAARQNPLVPAVKVTERARQPSHPVEGQDRRSRVR